MKTTKILTLICILMSAITARAEVWVYPGFKGTLTASNNDKKPQKITSLTSKVYKVEIIQNKQTYQSPVYEDYNVAVYDKAELKDKMTDFNHWTTFSFKDRVKVRITISAPGRSLQKCYVHPYSKKITAKITSKNTVEFNVSDPSKLFIRFIFDNDKDGGSLSQKQNGFGYENPLFIFADGPEKDVPSKKGKDVLLIPQNKQRDEILALIEANKNKKIIYFEEGVHYLDLRFPILPEKKYYVPGGAYLSGSMRGENVENTKIYGRGIISGIEHPRLPTSQNIKNTLINFGKGSDDNKVEGLTFSNAPHFCYISAGRSDVTNTKMFAWYYQTDGWESAAYSTLSDTFMKVFDANMKIKHTGEHVHDMVIYYQLNHSVMQLGFGKAATEGESIGCLVENFEIVQCDSDGANSVRAVFSNVWNKGKLFENYVIRNVNFDQEVQRLLTLHLRDDKKTRHLPVVRNWLFQNINMRQNLKTGIRLYMESKGLIDGIHFANVKINGKCVTNEKDLKLQKAGKADQIKNITIFCQDSPDKIPPKVSVKIKGKTVFELTDTMTVSANVTDKTGILNAKVFIDDDPVAPALSKVPFQWNLSELSQGDHILKVTGTDLAGNMASATVPFKVKGGNMKDALVNHFAFENNVNDSSKQGNHGKLDGSPIYVKGISGRALQFDGAKDAVIFPRPVQDDFSISFWIKSSAEAIEGIQWYEGFGLVDGEMRGYAPDYGVSLLNGKIAFGIGNADTTIQSKTSVNDNKWHHVTAVRYWKGKMLLYIDGVLEAETDGPSGTRGIPRELHIGRIRTKTNYFKGLLDEVKVFKIALTDENVKSLAVTK